MDSRPPGEKNSWRVGRVRDEVWEVAIDAGAPSIIGPSSMAKERGSLAPPEAGSVSELMRAGGVSPILAFNSSESAIWGEIAALNS